jgi:glycosyltransferase involved in cell wall biosynthesis
VGLRVTVITPSFNQGRFIERTIQSVLAQDVPDLEYVVCDGGSTDETVAILKRYEHRLRWVSERDEGQADAINKGIRSTRGDIVGWINSDDIYYPGALRAVAEFFEQHPERDAVYGDATHIDEQDRVLEPYYTEDWDFERFKDVCFMSQPAVFFRRRVVERHGLLDIRLRYCMDYDYWLRLGAHAPFARLRRTLAGSRLYRENKTIGQRVAAHAEINDMLKRRLGTVPRKWLYNYAFAVVDGAGLDRSQPERYVWLLVSSTVWAFLRWRHYVPPYVFGAIWSWLWSAYRRNRAELSIP